MPPLCRLPSSQFKHVFRLIPSHQYWRANAFDRFLLSFDTSSVRIAFAHLPKTHMTTYAAFSLYRSTPIPLGISTGGLFEACSCQPTSVGLPPCNTQHPFPLGFGSCGTLQSKRALALNIGLIKHNHLFGERCFMNLTAQENMP